MKKTGGFSPRTRRRNQIVAGATVVVAISIISFIWLSYPPNKTTQLKTPRLTYTLLLAKTNDQHKQGLSGRTNLPKDEAMLFVFPNEQVRCFWMKDMQFAIDIVWLNLQKEVVHIESDVSPNTYPRSFCPTRAAKYVLELNAGQAKVAGIRTGEKLSF